MPLNVPIAIPLTTLTDQTLQPTFPVPAGCTGFALALDRTALPNPLQNPLTGQMAMKVEFSWDGGVTWERLVDTVFTSGPMVDPIVGGLPLATAFISLSGIRPNANLVRVAAVVVGTVTIVGTVTPT
jgi:hypothetical protein